MYLLTYHQQTNYSKQTNELTKIIQEVVSPEVSKINYAVINKKLAVAVLSREKILEKTKWIHPTHHTSLGIVVDPSILLDFLVFVSKFVLSCNRKNS